MTSLPFSIKGGADKLDGHNAAQLNELTPIATVDNYQQLQNILLG